jgi:hypothetical protein
LTIRTIAVLLLVGGMLMSACSDDPLADAGRLTNDWIGERSTAARDTTPSTAAPPAYRSASEVAWFNDFLTADLRSADPAEALAAVWARRESGNKYVQAARTEIAGALPGVAFPELLPEDVEFISSQLLFDGDGTLADDYMAAFGLWTAEPYTVSRSVGQYGILWVAVPDPERSGCDRFSGRDIGACNAVVIGDMSGWVLKSGGDETLVWIAGDYQYEFFHRSHVAPETARLMAGALVPLIDLAPLPEGVAG